MDEIGSHAPLDGFEGVARASHVVTLGVQGLEAAWRWSIVHAMNIVPFPLRPTTADAPPVAPKSERFQIIRQPGRDHARRAQRH